jgi:hypothetical protein
VPFKVVRTNGSDEVLARASNLLIGRAAGPPKVQPHAVIGPTQACKRLGEREVAMLPIKIIIYIVRHEHADAPRAVALLRPRCEGPARYAPSPSGRRRSGRQDDARERNQRRIFRQQVESASGNDARLRAPQCQGCFTVTRWLDRQDGQPCRRDVQTAAIPSWTTEPKRRRRPMKTFGAAGHGLTRMSAIDAG